MQVVRWLVLVVFTLIRQMRLNKKMGRTEASALFLASFGFLTEFDLRITHWF